MESSLPWKKISFLSIPCSFEPAESNGSVILKYIHVINGLYDVCSVKFSLGNFDPAGHQSNSKIFKTPQAPPGNFIFIF